MLLHISKNQIESVVVQIVWKMFEAKEKERRATRMIELTQKDMCGVHAVRIVYH